MQFGVFSPPALLSALNRGQLARFRASDVPHIRSFLEGIGDDDDLTTTELAEDAVVGYGAGAAAAGLKSLSPSALLLSSEALP